MKSHIPYPHKPGAILQGILQCIAAGITAGVIANLFLVLIVLLLSDNAHATTMDDSELVRIKNKSDVKQGTLLFKNKQDFSMAPILKTEADISVSGMIVRVRVKQYFRNPDEIWKEGIYVFPLPEDAAVDHMRLHIGQRIIEGQIREREQARKEYEKARDTGKRASLVEQERANIFTTSVANIGPHEEIVVEIEYQHVARFDTGAFRLRFPMVVAPRYIPGNTVVEGFTGTGWALNTNQVEDASRITPPVLHPDKGKINPVTLRVTLDAGFPLQHIASSYHKTEIKQINNAVYEINLVDTPADRDFELIWKPEPGNVPRAAMFMQRKDNQDYALIMLLPPVQQVSSVMNREVIFVIDTSGSMAGTSIVQAKAALELALVRLKPGDRFNIIQFNSYMDQMFPFPKPVNRQTLNLAEKYIHDLKANGGTEMIPAMHAALKPSLENNLVRQVVFLTDGSIGNEDELFRIIHSELGNSRLFTIGIGSAPNSHFMSRAANFGRGTYTYIGNINEVQEKMQALFSKLESPVLTDLQIDWTGGQKTETWPQKIPDLYLGEPLLLTAKSENLPEKLDISGKIAGADWSSNMKLHGGMQVNGIHVLWARKKIAALMDQLNTGNEKNAVRQMIIDTALDHHLVSKFTSLVAVDVTPARIKEALLKSQAIPVNLPTGWNYEKVFGRMPQTATSAELHSIVGMFLLFASLVLYFIYTGTLRKNVWQD